MTDIRYYIEQAPDRLYSSDELAAAKACARRMSARTDDGIYLLAEKFDDDKGRYNAVGQFVFYSGRLDYKEGELA